MITSFIIHRNRKPKKCFGRDFRDRADLARTILHNCALTMSMRPGNPKGPYFRILAATSGSISQGDGPPNPSHALKGSSSEIDSYGTSGRTRPRSPR
jgi:hypothetical protein